MNVLSLSGGTSWAVFHQLTLPKVGPFDSLLFFWDFFLQLVISFLLVLNLSLALFAFLEEAFLLSIFFHHCLSDFFG